MHSSALPQASLVRGAEAGQAAALGSAFGALAVGQVGFFTPFSVVVRQPPCAHVNQELHAGLKSPPYSQALLSFAHALPTLGSVPGQLGAPAPTNSPAALPFGSLFSDAQEAIARRANAR